MTALGGDDLNAVLRRLHVLEAESEIRRLMSDNQWHSDAGSDDGAMPDWGDLHPTTATPPGSATNGRRSAWASEGPAWRGTGLRGGGFDGFDDVRGADFVRFGATRPEWMPKMFHCLTNESISVDLDAGTAVGRWYSWEAATVTVDDSPLPVWIAGRYVIDFMLEDDAWRIALMHFEEVFSTPFDSSGWVEHPHVRYGPLAVATGD